MPSRFLAPPYVDACNLPGPHSLYEAVISLKVLKPAAAGTHVTCLTTQLSRTPFRVAGDWKGKRADRATVFGFRDGCILSAKNTWEPSSRRTRP